MLDWFRDTHNLEVQMVSQGVSMLWSSFVPPKKVSNLYLFAPISEPLLDCGSTRNEDE